MAGLLRNPVDIGTMRSRLFELPEEIRLSAEQHDIYWPYVSNVWVRKTTNPRTEDGYQRTYYHCRLSPTEQRTPRGRGLRNKKIRVINEACPPCGMKLKKTAHFFAWNSTTISHYVMVRIGDCVEHSHDLDLSDSIKRNNALKSIAAEEIQRDYPAAVVTKHLTGQLSKRKDVEEALHAAGGAHLTPYDVRNAALAKRKTQSHARSEVSSPFSHAPVMPPAPSSNQQPPPPCNYAPTQFFYACLPPYPIQGPPLQDPSQQVPVPNLGQVKIPNTIPVLALGKDRDIVRTIASLLAARGFSINGIISSSEYTSDEVDLAMRVLEPRPKALLVFGGYTDGEMGQARRDFVDSLKDSKLQQGEGTVVIVGQDLADGGRREGAGEWIVQELRKLFKR